MIRILHVKGFSITEQDMKGKKIVSSSKVMVNLA